jgi:hypothetical protein
LQRELEANLAWVRQNVPDLRGIRVKRWTDLPPRPQLPEVIIQAHVEYSPALLKGKPIEWAWMEWALQTFAVPFPFKRFRFQPRFRPVTEE